MDEKEKSVKQKILKCLMDQMDDDIMSEFKPKDKGEIVHVEEFESKEMPIADAKEMIKEKMGSIPSDEEEGEDESDEEEFKGSRLMAKIKAAKKKKSEDYEEG